MQKLIIFITLFVYGPIISQTTHEFFDSERLGTRELKVQLPRNYEKNIDKFYPLIIVLDGDYLFEPIAGCSDYTAYWGDMPDVIVVGINQATTRQKDLTISDEDFFPIFDGARFYEFIGAELVPHMYENYRVNDFKAVVGHGDSANFINFLIFKTPPLFKAYISISPNISSFMGKNLIDRLSSLKSPLFYYLSTAEEDLKGNYKQILDLNNELLKINNENFYYSFDNFEDFNHYSLVPSSVGEALQHIFSVFRPISKSEYKSNIVNIDSSPVDYLKKKYDIIEDLFGVQKRILLNDFKAIASAIKKNQRFEYFKALAKLARDNYPNSLLSSFYMGRHYEGIGNTRKAIKAYQEGFVFDEIDGITKQDLLDRADQLKRQN